MGVYDNLEKEFHFVIVVEQPGRELGTPWRVCVHKTITLTRPRGKAIPSAAALGEATIHTIFVAIAYVALQLLIAKSWSRL